MYAYYVTYKLQPEIKNSRDNDNGIRWRIWVVASPL